MKYFKKLSFKFKIIIPAIILVLIIDFIWLYFFYSTQKTNFHNELKISAKKKSIEIENNIKRISKKALLIASGFTSLSLLENFYKNPDENKARQELRDFVKPIADKITKDLGYKILKIHYHKPPAKSFLRLWKKPGKGDGGDDLSSFRFTILNISKNHKPITGVELGRGGFVMRGLAPIFDKSNNYLGSVEALFPLNELIKMSSLTKDEGLMFFINKDSVGNIKIFENLKGEGIENFILKGTSGFSFDKIKNILTKDILNNSINENFFKIKGNYIFAGIPVKDFSKKSLGVFIFIRDISKRLSLFKKKTLFIAIITSTIIIALLIFISMLLSNSIKPFIKLKSAFEKASKGDLTIRLKVESQDEIGAVINMFNEFLENLSKLIGETKDNAVNLNASTETIATATEQMSANSEEQNSQANSVASAVEEMAASISEIGQNIKNTQENAIKSSELTTNSSEIISKTIDSINTISDRTENLSDVITRLRESTISISEIVNVINDIADQTNLLALNAAIEAARAGEAGRGFAVVADEVRKLAERTTKSTKEISDIISKLQKESDEAKFAMQDAISEVENGKKLGKKSIQVLNEVQSSSEGIVDLMSVVTKSIDELVLTVSEVNNNIQQIAESISGTNSAINNITETASQLSELSENMKNSVQKFKID